MQSAAAQLPWTTGAADALEVKARAMAIVIGPYSQEPVRFRVYDPATAQVAAIVMDALLDLEPSLSVEHIGSSSVPGCGGKGTVDLAVLYLPGELGSATNALDQLGFQPQPGPNPFPESRPMRVGVLELAGKHYPVHAHVLELGCPEHAQLLAFRDALRADTRLCRDYEAHKQAILADGVSNRQEYTNAKGTFVREVLAELRDAQQAL